MPQRRNLLQPEGSHRRHRAMAQSIQHDPTALILELSAASTPNIHSPIAAPGSQLPDAIVSIPLVQNIRQVNQVLARRTPSASDSNSAAKFRLRGRLSALPCLATSTLRSDEAAPRSAPR